MMQDATKGCPQSENSVIAIHVIMQLNIDFCGQMRIETLAKTDSTWILNQIVGYEHFYSVKSF